MSICGDYDDDENFLGCVILVPGKTENHFNGEHLCRLRKQHKKTSTINGPKASVTRHVGEEEMFGL